MNTEPDSQKKPDKNNPFNQLASKSGGTTPQNARSTAEVELEQKLAYERDARKEDRFVFMIVLVVIFNAWALQKVTTWTLPLVVGILQLFALVVLARRFGVQEIQYWINQFLTHMGPGGTKTEPKPTKSKNDQQQSPKEADKTSDEKETQ